MRGFSIKINEEKYIENCKWFIGLCELLILVLEKWKLNCWQQFAIKIKERLFNYTNGQCSYFSN